MRWLLAVFFILPAVTVFAADPVEDARVCLDETSEPPSSAEVDACLAPIATLDTAAADGVRCTGELLREGFGDTARFREALEALRPGVDGKTLRELAARLAFTASGAIAEDARRAARTTARCARGGNRGGALFAAFASFGNEVVAYLASQGACAASPRAFPDGRRRYDLDRCATQANPILLAPLFDAATAGPEAVRAQTAAGESFQHAYAVACEGTTVSADLCGVLEQARQDDPGGARARATALFKILLK